ncbi:MAG: hypothetical protein GC160_20275 [Acidobacteria bacterium]|nr:hypothetical protein [Acidobacteriota bacterium]
MAQTIATESAYDVYGYGFRVTGDCRFALEGIAQDFAFFHSKGPNDAPRVELELIEKQPDYDALPARDADIYTPRNVVYRDGASRILDFGGMGLGRFEAKTGRFRMESANPQLVYEAAYLFLLSQIGQALDGRGLHRLHSLAMSYKGRAILVLLPMGGGKSTLGAALLKHPEVKILSDDSPFIDKDGRSHAFPLRLGLLKGREHEVPEEHRRLIDRMEFGPKYLVNFSYFADRVVGSAEPGLVLLGRRTLARQGRLEPASYRAAMKAMIPNMVVGLGLFQGLEYILERSSRELAGKAGLALARLRSAHGLVRRSHNHVFHMSRDVAANAQMVLDLAERTFR